MKTQYINCLAFLFTTCFLFSCESSEEPTPSLRLEDAGFVGSLPDGRTFGTSGIKTASSPELSGDSNKGGFVHHGLAIRDEAGLGIRIQLPNVKFQESWEVLELDAFEVANEHYGYDLVKEKLALGRKNIPFEILDSWENNFYLIVTDQKNFNGYTISPGFLDEGDFLEVVQLIEGVEQNEDGEDVRIMDVIFDMDIKLRATDDRPHGNIKGQLRLKYREDFNPGGFAAN